MIGLLRPYRGRMALMFVALLIETGAGLAPPFLAGRAIDAGISTGDLSALDWIVAAFVVAAILYAVATYAETYLVGWVGTRALQDLRERIFVHIQGMSIGFFTRNSPGVLISRMTNDVEALQQLVTDRRGDDLLQHPDPGRRRRDPAPARPQAGADHLPHLPAAGDRQPRSSGSSRRAPTGPPASGSPPSPPTCRRASAACGWCAASARSRATSTR